MRIGSVAAMVLGGALLLSGCGREAGTDELGPVDNVTSATSEAAEQITQILGGAPPSDTATTAATSGTPTPSPTATPAAIVAPPRDTRDVLTVWLLPDVPDPVVTLVNKKFRKDYPKVDVNVVRQDWATIGSQVQEKVPLRAETPDILETGNSETTEYAGEGLLADLGSVRSDLQADAWTPGLKGSTEVDGVLAAVPVHGSGRVVAYDKAAWKAAGISEPPRSLAELSAALEKVQSGGVDPAYSAFWFPGRYWQGALPWIWSLGGELAVDDAGDWVGAVDSGESQAGLTELRSIVEKFSKAPVDADETSASQVKAFDEGRASAALMAPWEVDALTKQADLFTLPGVQQGTVAPQLLEGSNLSVSATSSRQGLAVAWLQVFLDLKVQKALVRQTRQIPGLAAAVAALKGDPMADAQAALAKPGKFTPSAANWSQVDKQQVLPDMLQTILTPVAAPTSAAPSPVQPSGSPVPLSSENGSVAPSGVPSALPSVPDSVPPSELPSLAPSPTG